MKKIFVITFLVSLFLGTNAQNNNPNAPVLKFSNETHDFGNLKEGPIASYDFVFTNTGKEPLIIQSCSASCGCTTPDWTKEPIAPNKSGKISVKYTTQGRTGTFNKTVYIASNAKCDKERYEIYIKGNVIPAQSVDSAPVKH
jgi:hypothetical protein